jgi:hypothetical protein
VILHADCLLHAEELAMDATVGLLAAEGVDEGRGAERGPTGAGGPRKRGHASRARSRGLSSGPEVGGDPGVGMQSDPVIVTADRLTPTQLGDTLKELGKPTPSGGAGDHAGVLAGRWLI